MLPPTYVFEGMRAMVAGGGISAHVLCISAGLAGVYIILACIAFARVYKSAVRTGLIARYTAENVG